MNSTGLIITLTNCRSDESNEMVFSWDECGISEEEYDSMDIIHQQEFVDELLENHLADKIHWFGNKFYEY